jgi:hypothetical protein
MMDNPSWDDGVSDHIQFIRRNIYCFAHIMFASSHTSTTYNIKIINKQKTTTSH